MLGRILASISLTHCTAFATGARFTISSAILQLLNTSTTAALHNQKGETEHESLKTNDSCAAHMSAHYKSASMRLSKNWR